MENNLCKLNDKLFEELDRLDQVDVSDRNALSGELERAGGYVKVARTIIDNASTVLKALDYKSNRIAIEDGLPQMLGVGKRK